jgi:chromosome partitioning protein
VDEESSVRWDDEVGRNEGGALEDQQLFLPDAFPPPAAPAPPARPSRPAPSSAPAVHAAAVAVTPPAPEDAPAEVEVVLEVIPEPLELLVEDPFVTTPQVVDLPVPPLHPLELVDLPVGRVVAVVNQKGGVGKTTSTINLGAALAAEGARVLLVDFDPQGALSVGLGMNPNSLELTVYNLLLDASVTFDEVVQHCKIDGLDLIPSNIDLAGAEIMLVSEVAREQSLKRALARDKDRYNYILIDCPPSLGLLTVNALTAAHAVLIPLECEYFALRGMALLMDTLTKIQERINPDLEIEGILATMLDARTIHGREVLSRVTDAFGDKLFKTIIHKTIKFAEAPVAGEPIVTYAPKSGGAREYRELAREVMSR